MECLILRAIKRLRVQYLTENKPAGALIARLIFWGRAGGRSFGLETDLYPDNATYLSDYRVFHTTR